MKAIILAAGKGTRLKPITDTIPKVMVEVNGKPLLEYNLEHLLPYVDEFIIVVKYKQETIRAYFGNGYKNIPIRYHEQGKENGTWSALWGIEIEWDCFIVTSDQIFNQKDVDLLARSPYYGALAKRVSHPEKYGIFLTDDSGQIRDIIEKPKKYIGNLASLLYFKVNADVLLDARTIAISERGEYELLDPISNFGKNHPFFVFPLGYPFLDITSIDDLNGANLSLLNLEKPLFWTSILLEKMNDYSLHVGIPESCIPTIIWYSLDENDISLKSNTGDRWRFSDYIKFEKWYNDDWRYVFSLLEPTGEIAGIWFGRPSQKPELSHIENQEIYDRMLDNISDIHTGGIRLYPNARGKGLAAPFIQRSSSYYRVLYPKCYMSIDIDSGNIPSQKAYEKSGYTYIWLWENQKTIEKNPHDRRVYVEIPRN